MKFLVSHFVNCGVTSGLERYGALFSEPVLGMLFQNVLRKHVRRLLTKVWEMLWGKDFDLLQTILTCFVNLSYEKTTELINMNHTTFMNFVDSLEGNV